MPQHIRAQIRSAAAQALQACAGVRSVLTSRALQVQEDDLPAILVSTPSETVDLVNPGSPRPRLQRRAIQINVAATITATDDVDDRLDDMAGEIEHVLLSDTTLGGLLVDLQLNYTSGLVAQDGEVPVGNVLLVFTAITRTPEGSSSRA